MRVSPCLMAMADSLKNISYTCYMYGMYKSDIFADCLTISCIQIPVEYVTLWPHSIPVPRGESKVDEKLNDPSLNHIIG